MLTENRDKILKLALDWSEKKLGKSILEPELKNDILWRPNIYVKKGKVALHILFYPGIKNNIVQEISQAIKKIKGLKLILIGPAVFFQKPEILSVALELDAQIVIIVEDEKNRLAIREYSNILMYIAKGSLILDESIYRDIVFRAYSWVNKAQKTVKGSRLEAFLAFLFSQVPGYEVFKTNYRSQTEEIDIVLTNRSVGGIYSVYSEPFIIVESKNWKDRAGKNEYVSLAAKITNRPASSSLGFFVSMNGFTTDFIKESLRNSKEKFRIIKLKKDNIEEIMKNHSRDLAIYMENLIKSESLE